LEESWLEIVKLIIGIIGAIVYGTYMIGLTKHPMDDEEKQYHNIKGVLIAKYIIASIAFVGFIMVVTH
jgi:hypothetical protein